MRSTAWCRFRAEGSQVAVSGLSGCTLREKTSKSWFQWISR